MATLLCMFEAEKECRSESLKCEKWRFTICVVSNFHPKNAERMNEMSNNEFIHISAFCRGNLYEFSKRRHVIWYRMTNICVSDSQWLLCYVCLKQKRNAEVKVLNVWDGVLLSVLWATFTQKMLREWMKWVTMNLFISVHFVGGTYTNLAKDAMLFGTEWLTYVYQIHNGYFVMYVWSRKGMQKWKS